MASFKVSGLDELSLNFAELAEMPEGVIDSMLNAEADMVVAAQKETAKSMLQGDYSEKDHVSKAVKKKKPKKMGNGRVLYITFDGVLRDKKHKKGTRIAEIAFINEFGKTNQPARPFVEAANEKSADAAVDAAAKVYDQYLKSKGL